jgi:hypothetical protein
LSSVIKRKGTYDFGNEPAHLNSNARDSLSYRYHYRKYRMEFVIAAVVEMKHRVFVNIFVTKCWQRNDRKRNDVYTLSGKDH